MHHARRAVLLAIIVAVSDLLSGYVVGELSLEGHWWALLIGASLAAAIITVFNKFNPFWWFTPLRRYFHGEISIYEGFWISDVSHPDRPYSVSKIYYSRHQNRWISRGYALSRQHVIVASWKGEGIHFDSELKYWFFKGVWWQHYGGSPHREGPAMDQFFKFKLNPGDHRSMSGIIIDNTEAAGRTSSGIRTEVLTSTVKRISSRDFNEIVFGRPPARLEAMSNWDPQTFEKLFNRFFGSQGQQHLNLTT